MMFRRKYHRGDRNAVKHARMLLVTHFMFEGLNLIVDNCNMNPHEIKQYKALAKKYQYDVKIGDFTDVPLELCLERNRRSENPVPENLIHAMHDKWVTPELDQISNHVKSI